MLGFLACQNSDHTLVKSLDTNYLHTAVQDLTDVMVFDIFSPPQASRNYAYPSLAAYEIMTRCDSSITTFSGKLNAFQGIRDPENPDLVHCDIAAVHAFYLVGKQFIYSTDKLDAGHQETLDQIRSMGIPEDVMSASLAYGETATEDIMAYAKTDGYAETRTMAHFEFEKKVSGKWIPTPPNFMNPIEPNWNKLRSFTLDSATQFIPPRPSFFDRKEGSDFYKEMIEVYKTCNNLTQEQREIASFWDCNPYVVLHEGHYMRPIKKITPGGHWMGIARIAGIKSNANLARASEIYAWTSIALADGFISCWDEKYRSNYIRPETAINTMIDNQWRPILQTPPFPEYTSGHSVISTAAATALTELLGEGFSFTDSVEVKYGLPVRSFDSFQDASNEAAISRLYGGIHFMPAINEGVKQGRKVGNKVIETLKG
jgi:hypothetical protein